MGQIYIPSKSGSSGVIGSAINYAPAAGAVDPGTGIAGFTNATGRLKVTLAGNTTFEGLPIGIDGQLLIILVVAGAFLLTLNTGVITAGAKFLGSAPINLQLNDALECFYDGGLGQWVLVP